MNPTILAALSCDSSWPRALVASVMLVCTCVLLLKLLDRPITIAGMDRWAWLRTVILVAIAIALIAVR